MTNINDPKSAAPGSPEEVETSLGSSLRSLRKARNLTISALADRSRVSSGMISQIERGAANPSFKIMERLCDALHVSLSALLERDADKRLDDGDGPVRDTPDAAEARIIRRAADRPVFKVGTAPFLKELLSPVGAETLQFMTISLPPGAPAEEVIITSGQKAGLVMNGEICLMVDGERYMLRSGDSFQFESSVPHSISNPTERVANVLWIMVKYKTLQF